MWFTLSLARTITIPVLSSSVHEFTRSSGAVYRGPTICEALRWAQAMRYKRPEPGPALRMHHLTKQGGATGARLTTEMTVPSRKSVCVGDIFHWGEADAGRRLGPLRCAVTDGLSGEGGLDKLDSSEGSGLARKRRSIPRVEGACLLPFGCVGLWLLNVRKMNFFSDHRWAKGF